MTSQKIPCQYCETCSRPACSVRSVPSPSPSPIPNPSPIPIVTPVTPIVTPVTPTPIVPVPSPSGTKTSLASWFTQDLWDKIFPYADLSAVYCPTDKKPFWTRDDFIAAVDWMDKLPDSKFHGFGTSADLLTNKYEVAAFLGNYFQETADPSITAPYPWLFPKADPISGPEGGPAGGGLSVVEGLAPLVAPHKKGTSPPFTGPLSVTLTNLRPTVRKTIGLRDDDVISCIVQDYAGANQPQFGLGFGTGAGAVISEHYVSVSDDGTLWGDKPKPTKDIIRSKKDLVISTTDRSYACRGTYCGYGGRGAIQLSYSYGYSDCSLDLFGDYRLCKYPNLIITTDRDTWNGLPIVFGFPGPNEGGKNRLPADISSSTPPARLMAWITSLWFWMIPRSGRPVSCHYCMLNYKTHSITGVNLIVNNQSGLVEGTWAAKKIVYYKRICNIFGIPWEGTIANPPAIK